MSREPASYNTEFTDADLAQLIQLATYANDRPYVCLWETQGVACNSNFQAGELPEHLRSAHGVVGSEKASFICCWVGCSVEMKKESLIRHINEKHLNVKFPCPFCHEQFTRAHTVQNHVLRKHSGS